MGIQFFTFLVNSLSALLWQYNNSPKLTQIFTDFQNLVVQNQTDFWNDWIEKVFTLTTAEDFGLSVWAIILNIPFTEYSDVVNPQPWGFDPEGNGYFNFDNGTFSEGSGYAGLSIVEKRFLLLLRWFQLTTRGNILDVNKYLNSVVPMITNTGTIYMVDNKNMSITYKFTFRPDSRIIQIIDFYNLLPVPAGVNITYDYPPM